MQHTAWKNKSDWANYLYHLKRGGELETSDWGIFGIAMVGVAILSGVLLTIQSIFGIWAINTLFAMRIPINLEMILAALILIFIIQGGAKFNFKR